MSAKFGSNHRSMCLCCTPHASMDQIIRQFVVSTSSQDLACTQIQMQMQMPGRAPHSILIGTSAIIASFPSFPPLLLALQTPARSVALRTMHVIGRLLLLPRSNYLSNRPCRDAHY